MYAAKNERKRHFLEEKLGLLLLLLFALFTTAARAAAVARGREYSAAEAGSAVGYEEGRRLAEHTVSSMTELFDKVSNTGADIMTNGDTTTLSVGEYKCSDGTCSTTSNMLTTANLYGTIRCLNDDASCILNGESYRRVMYVSGTGPDKLTIRAIRFYKAKSGSVGAGVFVADDGEGVYDGGAKVDFTLCVFDSCQSTLSFSGGGGIYVSSGFGPTVNIYATTFTGNSAASGNGNDIYIVAAQTSTAVAGTVTIHGTCPTPYSANTPKQGKYENSIHFIGSL